MNSANPPPKPTAGWVSSIGIGIAVATIFFAFHVLNDQLHPSRDGQTGGQSGANSTTSPKITPLPPLSSYTPTPQHEAQLRHFVQDVLVFTLLHETGHLLFNQYDVPVGSQDTNESAADSFAATVMMSHIGNGSGPQYNGLISAALFWDALNTLQQTSAPGQYDWADFHEQPEQRASKLACILYGANPQAFTDIAVKFKLQDQRDACIANAAATRRTWSRVISLNLDPDAGKPLDLWAPHVAVLYHSIPEHLPDGLKGQLARQLRIVQDLGTLDFIGRNLLVLKTPPNFIVDMGQRALVANRLKHPSSVLLAGLSLMPHVDHPSDGDPLLAYNYTVVGDSCLNDKGQPILNAFWEPNSKSITLCYGFVAMVEFIGKRLLADTH